LKFIIHLLFISPQGLNFTALYADLSLLWFLSAGFYFLFLLINCGTVQLWYWCGGKEAGKKRLRLKGWTVAAMSGAIAERVADNGQAFASLPASGARVADKEP
jgi:hypothetical protein